jgi:signal transduction histidine kinase
VAEQAKSAPLNSMRSQVAQVLLGPWIVPLAPLFAVTALVFVVANSDTIGGTSTNGAFLLVALIAIYNSGAFVLGVGIALRIFGVNKRSLMTRSQYLIAVLAGGLFLALSRVSVFQLDLIPYPDGAKWFLIAIRGFTYSFLTLSLMGYSYTSISRAVVRADSLAAQLQKQNTLLVSEDEKLRSSVSQFLHNRVQSQIMAVSLQLQQLFAKPDVSLEVSRGGASIIAELERIRSEDLRSAIRALSPDIPTIGLSAAVRELAQTHEPQLEVTQDINIEQIDDKTREIVEIACYRIIEQALVNAVVHGEASMAEVRVSCDGPMILVEISDNGSSTTGEVIQGSGLSLVDNWTNSLDGSWNLSLRPGRGATLSCQLRAPANKQL